MQKNNIMYSLNWKEEQLKNQVRNDFFPSERYNNAEIIGDIDFAIAVKKVGLFDRQIIETEYLLWAESKKGNKHNIYDSFIQLILTIGKNKSILGYHTPPKFLGAFDAEKIAFIPYSAVMEVFSQNDFNWNVTPSNHNTKEFQQLSALVHKELEKSNSSEVFLFSFHDDNKELKNFIKKNFVIGRSIKHGIRITQNNFVAIYEKWRKEVAPSIKINWEQAKKHGILETDFYLADIMSSNNKSLDFATKLHVLLDSNHYEMDRHIDENQLFSSTKVEFKDNMMAHSLFWSRYERPPRKEYWNKIVERRDLIVPQDVRERKGSFFTPRIWVEKSQEYLADVLGDNWQEEYYVWDCCAGTGNLLAGLTNKYNIWASTLDKADVKVMHERIDSMGERGSNLLKSHVFQFDFLNDEFSKLPKKLQDIINDEEKRKKLVIYINPPYVEAANAKNISGKSKNRKGVATQSLIAKNYKNLIGSASNELFAQFFIRIYCEIPGAVLAEFSKLKILQAPNFADFRKIFRAKLEKMFVVPANTFDNVKGHFPIGFFVWQTAIIDQFKEIYSEIYIPNDVDKIGDKYICVLDNLHLINSWYANYYDTKNPIGIMNTRGNDFQNHNYVRISTEDCHNHTNTITVKNIIPTCIYLAVRHCIEATWLNDRDQFLYPKEGWKTDKEFQSDCLAYTLFHKQNYITSTKGINHWIPFTEKEVDAPDNFQSHFMSDFIAGKNKAKDDTTLFEDELADIGSIHFSPEAQAVMNAGRELWYYYLHCAEDGVMFDSDAINVDASFYDIRKHFQGVDAKGRMNSNSEDERYTKLIRELREKHRVLADKIAKKVYLYGFLK